MVDASAVDLTGQWVTDDYECPSGVKHRERVRIVHSGHEVRATKVDGDDCVPAGFETFAGTLPAGASTGAITWQVGTPRAPASGTASGFLRVLSQTQFVAGSESMTDMLFRRLE